MKRFVNSSVVSLFVAGLICAISVPCFGQRNQGNGGGFGGPGGGQGGFGNNGQPPDPGQIQQMMQHRQQAQLDSLKADLGASDDDFAAILPKIQKVIDAQTVVNIGTASMQANRFRGAFAGQNGPNGPNGPGGPGAQQPGGPNGANNPFATPGGVNQFLMQMTTSQVGKQLLQAVTDLQTVLADPNAPADVILSRLESLRMIKAKAAQDLVDAQADLQSVLTQRQEAAMVVNGLLN